MSTKLGVVIADFRTSLAAKIAVGGTSATLVSATDDDSVALPSGVYFFTIDGENSSKEHFVCDLSGTALTNLKSISRQGAQTSGAVREHRVGASVTITNFAHLKYINDLLDGTTDFDATTPFKYDGTASITDDAHFATKKYADDLAIAGSPDMSVTVKGIAEEATEAEINAGTAAGGTSARLAINPATLITSIYGIQLPSSDEKDALAGSVGTPSDTNRYITEDDTERQTPPGVMLPYAGASAPTGWLLCDGDTGLDSVGDTTLAALFAIIGTTFGGVGAADFDLPDMRGNLPLGKDNMGGVSRDRVTHANADTVGAEEGVEDHQLIEAEMPAHTHSVVTEESGSSGAGVPKEGVVSTPASVNTDSKGGDTAHENMPPYMTLNYIIKK